MLSGAVYFLPSTGGTCSSSSSYTDIGTNRTQPHVRHSAATDKSLDTPQQSTSTAIQQYIILRLAILKQYQRVTDKTQTHVDSQCCVSMILRGKNRSCICTMVYKRCAAIEYKFCHRSLQISELTLNSQICCRFN